MLFLRRCQQPGDCKPNQTKLNQMTPTQYASPVFSARNKPRRTSNGNLWISSAIWISYLLTVAGVSALVFWATVSLIAFFSNL
jgi:hypothetical protein